MPLEENLNSNSGSITDTPPANFESKTGKGQTQTQIEVDLTEDDVEMEQIQKEALSFFTGKESCANLHQQKKKDLAPELTMDNFSKYLEQEIAKEGR